MRWLGSFVGNFGLLIRKVRPCSMLLKMKYTPYAFCFSRRRSIRVNVLVSALLMDEVLHVFASSPAPAHSQQVGSRKGSSLAVLCSNHFEDGPRGSKRQVCL